ncbi:MAG TPA: hypothetical protein VMV18_03890, partial [bacterium]|nr:hypothetical protein [bacterium]
ACVGPATLTPASALPAGGEGLLHAPILKWPVKKRFDDLPVVLGWSQAKRHYELFYTNENGGTVAQCGGGADGMQAEIARWGRGFDVEGIFTYNLVTPNASTWERCTGTIPFSTTPVRMEGAHPILYYGDGHNRLFESRGGYGQTCGTGAPEKADGDITGWNVQNPGNDASNDPLFTVTIRPVPVEMDPLGYPAAFGRREGVPDHYAPWLYRLTDSEIKREGKVDEVKTRSMERYLFADVHAADVGGSGDGVCSLTVSGGFVMRAKTKDGGSFNGPQMTADYFGGQVAWKRIAIPLDRMRAATDFNQLVFDAYDNDGIYFLDMGDSFMPRPAGENGASLETLTQGDSPENVYVDDDNSSCTNGVNTGGPQAGYAYPCKGSFFAFTP